MALADGIISRWCASLTDSPEDVYGRNDGTYQGGLATIADTDAGGSRAYDFSPAGTQRIALGDIDALDGIDRISVSGWMKNIDYTAAGGLFTKGAYFNTGASFYLGYVHPNGRFGWSVKQTYNWEHSVVYLESEWQHIVWTYDKVAGEAYLYSNGVQIDSGLLGGSYITIPATTNGCYIGGNAGGSTYLKALVDDVAVWDRILTAGERAQLYNAHAGRGIEYDPPLSQRQVRDTRLRLTGQTEYSDRSNYRQLGVSPDGNVSVVDGMFNVTGTEGDEIHCPYHSSLGMISEFSVSCFVRIETHENFACLVAHGDTSAANASWMLRVWSDQKISFYVRDSSNIETISAYSATPMTVGVIYHVVAVFNTDTAVVYLDGVAGPTATFTGGRTGIRAITEPIRIGRDANYVGARIFNGQLDGITLIARALSAGEVMLLYNRRVVDYEPVGLLDETSAKAAYHFSRYSMDGQPTIDHVAYLKGDTLTDTSRFAHTVNTNGAPTVVSGAIEFDGTNDGLELPSHTEFDTTTEISVSAKVRLESNGSSRIIVSKDFVGGVVPYDLRTLTGTPRFGFYDGTWKTILSTAPLTLGQWYYVTGTYNSATGYLAIYVDGVLKASTTTSGAIPTNISPLLVSDYLNANRWHGGLKDIRVDAREMSATEVASLHGVGDVADESGNGNSGTLAGGAAITDGALVCDGVDDEIKLTSGFAWTDSTTLVCHVTPDTVTGTQIAVEKGSTELTWGVWLGRAGSQYRASVVTSAVQTTITGGTATAGVEAALAVTWNSTTKALKLYVDGVEVASGTSSGTALRSSTGIRIGSHGDGSNWWDGSISDVRIINTDLTLAEIKFLASESEVETPNTLGSVAAWLPSHQDPYAGSGTARLVDVCGLRIEAAMRNMDAATDWVADTNSGGIAAVELDGTNEDLLAAYSPRHVFAGDKPFSLVSWANPYASASGQPLLARYFDDTPMDGEYHMGLGSDGKFMTQKLDGSPTIRCRQDESVATGLNTGWHCFIALVDGTAVDEAITLYVDGVAVATVGKGQDASYVSMVDSLEGTTLGSVLTGPTSFTQFFVGLLDGSLIYPRLLTRSQIAMISASRTWYQEPVAAGGPSLYHIQQKQKLILQGSL